MSKIVTTTAAIIMFGVAAMGAAQARAINHSHHRYVHPGYAGPVYAPAEPRGGGFAWSAQRRDGYDGSRYWWGGDCWPTEPGGCD